MGSTEQSSQGRQTTTTKPWEPTTKPLQRVINRVESEIPNTKTTATEQGAFNTLTANANAGNPFTDQTMNLANNLFAGGAADANLADYNRRLSPFADGQMMGPDGSNPQLKSYLDTIGNDVSNRVNSMFAGAGRDMSGANQGQLARGLAEGMAPVLAQQYNTDIGRRFDAANSLYGAGNTTDQMKMQYGMSGIDVGNKALEARDSGANRLLDIEGMKRNLPIGNLGNISGLLTPLAQLGGRSNTNSVQSSVTTPPIGMQIAQVGTGLLSATKAPNAGWGGGK